MKQWTKAEYRARDGYDRALDRLGDAVTGPAWEHYRTAAKRLDAILCAMGDRP